jgi:alanine-synthesizing transaminase
MFSSRTNWDLTPNRLSQLAQEKQTRGEQILDLTESNPTRCGFEMTADTLTALSSEKSKIYQPHPAGILSARQAIANWYGQRKVVLDPTHIVLTSGTSEGYSYCFKLLCNPGESVLIPKPGYPLFDDLCRLHDVEAIPYHLRYDGEWNIDVESLHDLVETSTRAILLVHPNNPTGSFVSIDERAGIVELARRHNLALIVDEVFGEYPLEEQSDRSGTFAGEKSVLTFTLNGISKLLGLPQLKLAWMVVSGQESRRDEALARLEMISDTYLSVGSPIQHALPYLLHHGHFIAADIHRRLENNLQSLRSIVAHYPQTSLLKVEGGWNALIRLPDILADDGWAESLLKDCNVLVHPGNLFDLDERSSIVVSLLLPEGSFSDGIEKILRLAENT